MTETDINKLLIDYSGGDNRAFEQLLPLVYRDLRRISHRQLNQEGRFGETLNTYALVHEVYLKLSKHTHLQVKNRNHFFAIAARAMRQIIVDYARKRSAGKRGGGARPVSLDQVQPSVAGQAETLIVLDEALTGLGEFNQRLARVFECRYFAGYTEMETSEALDMPLRTVQRDWVKSKAWLREKLAPGGR